MASEQWTLSAALRAIQSGGYPAELPVADVPRNADVHELLRRGTPPAAVSAAILAHRHIRRIGR